MNLEGAALPLLCSGPGADVRDRERNSLDLRIGQVALPVVGPAVVPERPQPELVLVVEDDRDVSDALVEVILSSGRAVQSCRNGLEALEALRSIRQPCVILLDLLMPCMDGFAFLEQLTGHPRAREFPVVVMSAHASIAQARAHPGVRSVLRKPFGIGELLNSLDRHLRASM